MAEKNYSKRELDAKFQNTEDVSDANRKLLVKTFDDGLSTLQERFTNFEQDVRGSLSRVEIATDAIDKKVSYTNGKVRKIIIALVLIGGIVIGQTFSNTHDIIALVTGILH